MELRRYGVATTVFFPLIDKGATDFEATPVTIASGDTQISKDGGAFANTTNAFAHEGNGIYSLSLTATEMEAKQIVITVKDQGTKEWEDQAIIITTNGHASAEIPNLADAPVATVDTVVDAIKAKTDNLPSDPADQSALEALLNAIDDFVDTEVAAIKAKTDLISGAPATTADIPSADDIAQAVLTRDIATTNDEDAATVFTLVSVILKLASRFKATTGETYKSDGSTVHMTQTPTTDAAADPITELGAGS